MTHPMGSGSGSVLIEVVGRTDVGRRRANNEDAFLIADLSTTEPSPPLTEVQERRIWPLRTAGTRGMLFVVADGMGGAAAGELASGIATAAILEEVRAQWVDTTATDPDRFAQSLRLAIERANQRIHAHATSHPDTTGMGTTVTLAGLLGDTLYLCQVGDSRAYVVRRGIATQITKDQSLMQRLIDAGELTPQEGGLRATQHHLAGVGSRGAGEGRPDGATRAAGRPAGGLLRWPLGTAPWSGDRAAARHGRHPRGRL